MTPSKPVDEAERQANNFVSAEVSAMPVAALRDRVLARVRSQQARGDAE